MKKCCSKIKKKLHKSNCENLLKILLLINVNAVLIAVFGLILYKYRNINIIDQLFFNKDDVFQWIGVTAIVAIVSFLVTTVNNFKKNKQDLVSKSRIDWIQRVREDASIFISSLSDYTLLTVQLSNYINSEIQKQNITQNLFIFGDSKKIIEYNLDNISKEDLEEILKQESIIESLKRNKENNHIILLHKSKMSLYFPIEDTDKRNEKVLEKIKSVSAQVLQSDNILNVKNVQDVGLRNVMLDTEVYEVQCNKKIEELSTLISSYLKIEWDKAKRGK